MVVSVFEPLYDNAGNSGSPYFREPLSLRLGLVDSDGKIVFPWCKLIA